MPPRIILAGATGFLGDLLARHLAPRFRISILSRRPQKNSPFQMLPWDGRTLGPWAAELESACALINLAGRSVNCRYTARNRRLLMDSRILSTHVLGSAVAQCRNPPKVWLNSSTATIYRHTLGPAWDESGDIAATPAAKDAFSIDVATAWEREFFSCDLPHTRRAALRTAIVFGNHPGTIFPILRTLAKLALAGRMGDGRQWVSWIHETDFARAVEFILSRDDLTGPVNLAGPNPITNAEMMRTLRDSVRTKLGLPAPRWLLEIGAFFHRTETELLIKSRHVVPGKLAAANFHFYFPLFGKAIADLIAANKPGRGRLIQAI